MELCAERGLLRNLLRVVGERQKEVCGQIKIEDRVWHKNANAEEAKGVLKVGELKECTCQKSYQGSLEEGWINVGWIQRDKSKEGIDKIQGKRDAMEKNKLYQEN